MTPRTEARLGLAGVVVCSFALLTIFAIALYGHVYVSMGLAGLFGLLLGWSWLVWSDARRRMRERASFARWLREQERRSLLAGRE